MFLSIPDFLTEQELQHLHAMTDRVQFSDGTATADDLHDDYKRNLQYVRQGEDLRAVSQLISNGVARSREVQDGALIKRTMPPMISKYTEGMEYKSHLDSPFMQHHGP